MLARIRVGKISTSILCFSTRNFSEKNFRYLSFSIRKFPLRQNAVNCKELHCKFHSSSRSSAAIEQESASNIDDDALLSTFFKAAKCNDVAAAEDILESDLFSKLKESVNLTDAFGNSPLMICAQRNWHDSISLLLANDHCDVNHQNIFGSSALMCSSSHGHIDALKALLNSEKVEIDLVSRFGQTALMKAAQAGKLTSIRVLISSGANPSILNKQGKGALQIAEEKGHRAVVDYLSGQLP
jgi:ankyrin repeat protein